MLKKLIFLVLILAVIGGVYWKFEGSSKPRGWSTYNSEEYQFSFDYPSQCEVINLGNDVKGSPSVFCNDKELVYLYGYKDPAGRSTAKRIGDFYISINIKPDLTAAEQENVNKIISTLRPLK